MKKLKKFISPFTLLAVLSGLFFVFLVFRNTGLYPTVFADEYIYSLMSRILPLRDSSVPSYIYLKLFSITNYCQDGFLGCAKLINAILFVGATPFIFLISRRVSSNSVSVFVSLLAIFGPISSYTAYFMPESFYFLTFWMLCWYLTDLKTESGRHRWLFFGVLYAISALVKPHTMLFLPAVLIYIGFLFFREKRLFSRYSAAAFILFAMGLLLAKFGISYILAGSAGLTFFGSTYSSIATSAASGTERYIALLLLAIESFKGHMMVLALVYGLPLTLAFLVSAKALRRASSQLVQKYAPIYHYENIAFLTLLIVFNLILVTSVFTASVASAGPYESPYRLHMRYYNFALPLFYIIAAETLYITEDVKKLARSILGTIVAILGIYAIWSNLGPYTPNQVDSPEIRGLYANHFSFNVIGGLLILAIFIWISFNRLGIQFYVYVSLPLFVCISSFNINAELNRQLNKNVYDDAGIFTRQYLSADEISKVVVVGSEAAGLYRTLYYLDNAKASFEVLSKDFDYDLKNLPIDKEWILAIGGSKIVGKTSYKIPMNGFNLYRKTIPNSIDFKKAFWPGIIENVRGLSSPEGGGTWSQSSTVLFEFSSPLPSEFELRLVAHAFGPNIGDVFEISVGGDLHRFGLEAIDSEKIINFKNPDGIKELRMKIPNATSPKTLGISGDERQLGVGFVEMQIIPTNK